MLASTAPCTRSPACRPQPCSVLISRAFPPAVMTSPALQQTTPLRQAPRLAMPMLARTPTRSVEVTMPRDHPTPPGSTSLLRKIGNARRQLPRPYVRGRNPPCLQWAWVEGRTWPQHLYSLRQTTPEFFHVFMPEWHNTPLPPMSTMHHECLSVRISFPAISQPSLPSPTPGIPYLSAGRFTNSQPSPSSRIH